MIEGHLHKVILTFFIGKLLGEQQCLVFGRVPPLIVESRHMSERGVLHTRALLGALLPLHRRVVQVYD